VSDNRREELRTQVYAVGKEAYIIGEMIRLGFWPPETEASEKREAALKELDALYPDLRKLQSELKEVEDKIASAGNIEAILADIRKARIERVKAAREQRKIEKAQKLIVHREAVRQRKLKTPSYLGVGWRGLHWENKTPLNLSERGLPDVQDAEQLAAAIGITPEKLRWLSFHRNVTTVDHYTRFTIPKRSGGTRIISSPKKDLRTAQSWILREILEKPFVTGQLHPAAMAFRPGRSINDNAAAHAGKAVVIKMDLKDFFPSIKLPRVVKLFWQLGFNEGVASVLALLATEAPRLELTFDEKKRYVATGERCLPQGACTSPALTNLLCKGLDGRLAGLAAKFGFSYTRYADDLVFSHDNKDVKIGLFMKLVRKVIVECGFTVNEPKTRVMRPQHRQAVTGLVVNEKAAVSREDLRRYRALLHRCETRGFEAVSEELGKPALSYARGYLAFIGMVEPERAAAFRRKYSWLN
jgi:RNA-directed DNA polymerase